MNFICAIRFFPAVWSFNNTEQQALDDIVSEAEAELVRTAQQLARKVINVDSFSREQVERKYKGDQA
jgi:hypothetical protein